MSVPVKVLGITECGPGVTETMWKWLWANTTVAATVIATGSESETGTVSGTGCENGSERETGTGKENGSRSEFGLTTSELLNYLHLQAEQKLPFPALYMNMKETE